VDCWAQVNARGAGSQVSSESRRRRSSVPPRSGESGGKGELGAMQVVDSTGNMCDCIKHIRFVRAIFVVDLGSDGPD
jgi:hypothetical protein